MDQSGRTRRLVAELLIIVMGVLIALGAQGAVQEWSDRRHEHAFLVDLLAEFRLNEAQLEKDLEVTNQAVAAADLWRAEGPGSANLPADSVAGLYAASLNPARFDPISGQAAPAEALKLDRLLLEVIGDQQNALLTPLHEIIAMLEEEVGI